MKRFLTIIVPVLLLAGVLSGRATEGTKVNTSVIISPPMPTPVIDATNFVNENYFFVQTTTSPFNSTAEDIFDFSSVENFTNNNLIIAYPGVQFDTAPVSAGVRKWARNFVNANRVLAGGVNSGVYGEFFVYVDATNIVNRGIMSLTNRPITFDPFSGLFTLPALLVPEYGLIRLRGERTDVASSAFDVGSVFGERQVRNPTGGGTFTALNRPSILPEGMYDTFWGYGSFTFNHRMMITPTNATTPTFDTTRLVAGANSGSAAVYVTDTAYSPLTVTNPGVTNQCVIRNSFLPTGTNRTAQIVILRHTNQNIAASIAFFGNTPTNLGVVVIDWATQPYTNAQGRTVTNFLRLLDYYGVRQESNVFVTNYIGSTPPPQLQAIPPLTLQPVNFNFYRSVGAIPNDLFPPGVTAVQQISTPWPGWGLAGTVPAGPNNIGGTNPTANASFSAYRLRLTSTSIDPQYISGPVERTFAERVRDLPGRVEITGQKHLDLNRTRIQSLNYLKLEGTNHFAGSSNAIISTAFSDIRLGSTNGSLAITNLLQFSLSRLTGHISMISEVWSNSVVEVYPDPMAITNNITNVVVVPINVLIVDSTGLQDRGPSEVLDFTLKSTGRPGSNTVSIGNSFNVLNRFEVDTDTLVVESNAVLNLMSDGITWSEGVPNVLTVSNLGTINNLSNSLYFLGNYAGDMSGKPYRDFVNLGTIFAGGNVIAATNVINRGAVNSGTGELFVRGNTVTLLAPGAFNASNGNITISANNLVVSNHAINAGHALTLAITNSIVSGPNTWSVNDGFNLLRKPATGDLLGTTVNSVAFSFANIFNIWGGADFGPTLTGFSNNAAVGRLALNGGLNSQFEYMGAGAEGESNGLYVVSLELSGSVAVLDAATNIPALLIHPNLTIYYLTNRVGGVDMSAQLDGKNNGRLRRVLGGAPLLADSPAMKAKAYTYSGTFFVAGAGGGEAGAVVLEVVPLPAESAVLVSWNTPANAASSVYIKPEPDDEWALLTTYMAGGEAGRVTVKDAITAEGRIYKVVVSPAP